MKEPVDTSGTVAMDRVERLAGRPRKGRAVSRVLARYAIETAFPLEDVAAAMAGEQSTGTFLKLAAEDDPLVLSRSG